MAMIGTIAAGVVRTTAHMAWEKSFGRRPRRAADVPRAVGDLTPEWLTTVLCRKVPGAEVTAFTVTGVEFGTNDRAAVNVTYNAAGQAAELPTVLFHKCISRYLTRLMHGLLRMNWSEAQFYTLIRPGFSFETPRCFHAGFDTRSWRSTTLLENVAATSNASFCNALSTVSRSDIEAMLSILASFHGQYWASAQLDRDLGWLKTLAQFRSDISGLIDMDKQFQAGLDAAIDVVPASILAQRDQIWPAMVAAFESNARQPQTLLHGDPHIGNFYRTGTGAMGICDWETVMRGCWAYDFAYTLATALPVEARRAWEKDLLAFYLDRLKAAGGDPPDASTAWDLYRQNLLYPLITWLFTYKPGRLQPNMQPPAISRATVGRLSTAVADLDAIAFALQPP